MSYHLVRCRPSFLLLASFLPFAFPACLIRSVHHVYSNGFTKCYGLYLSAYFIVAVTLGLFQAGSSQYRYQYSKDPRSASGEHLRRRPKS